MPRPDGPTIFLGTSIVVATAVGLYMVFGYERGRVEAQPRNTSRIDWRRLPFDGEQAYAYLKQICDIGPRPTGSPGMTQQQELLTAHFTRLGGLVARQEFQIRHPQDGSAVPVANLIVQWHPERKTRVLLCAHYDTRPFPDRDRERPQGVFVGANDGGSGVALLMELGQHMREIQTPIGVDFAFFDAEEFVFDERRDKDYYFVGSTHFARTHVAANPEFSYKAGVLFDMVADANLQLYQERNSIKHARPTVTQLWNTAERLGIHEFIHRPGHELRDDHLPLNEIAKIPTCDIIDFDYPRPGARYSYWHTEDDRPDKCSAESLAKVGSVALEWLKSLRAPE